MLSISRFMLFFYFEGINLFSSSEYFEDFLSHRISKCHQFRQIISDRIIVGSISPSLRNRYTVLVCIELFRIRGNEWCCCILVVCRILPDSINISSTDDAIHHIWIGTRESSGIKRATKCLLKLGIFYIFGLLFFIVVFWSWFGSDEYTASFHFGLQFE